MRLDELRSEEFFACLIEHIFDNKSIFKMIFSPNGTNHLREKFSRLMEGLFRKLISEHQDRDITDDRIGYYSCYRTQGCIAIVEKWVQNGLSDPKELIISTLSELDRNTEELIFKS